MPSKQVKAMHESLLFNFDGATVAHAATMALIQRGFYVVRSFDLRSALTAHSECECPYHGTSQCTCQFIVLLIYGDNARPATLTVHCRDRQAQAQIVSDPATQPDPSLAKQVMAALQEAALALQTTSAPSAVTLNVQ